MVELDEIIEELDPDKVHEKVGKRHEEARAKYKAEKSTAEDWDDFKKQIINYVKHHHQAAYGTEMDDHRAYSIAVDILSKEREKGGFGGLEAALSTGRKKMREVFDRLAAGLQGEEEEAYTLHVLHKVDPLDFGAHTELMTQYLAKYQGILPKGITTRRPEELAREYPRLVQALATDVYSKKGILEAYKHRKKAA